MSQTVEVTPKHASLIAISLPYGDEVRNILVLSLVVLRYDRRLGCIAEVVPILSRRSMAASRQTRCIKARLGGFLVPYLSL